MELWNFKIFFFFFTAWDMRVYVRSWGCKKLLVVEFRFRLRKMGSEAGRARLWKTSLYRVMDLRNISVYLINFSVLWNIGIGAVVLQEFNGRCHLFRLIKLAQLFVWIDLYTLYIRTIRIKCNTTYCFPLEFLNFCPLPPLSVPKNLLHWDFQIFL